MNITLYQFANFLSTLSLRRATGLIFFDLSFFLSTLSLRRATTYGTRTASRYPTFLSTLSLRRATRCRPLCVAQYDFSIHALLAESDPCIPTGHSGALHFLSTLSLRRATQRTRSAARATFIFLSTLSLRRATARASTGHNLRSFFYPRSPCGERPILDFFLQSHIIFLSTLSLRRATLLLPVPQAWQPIFYPRSPCGERPPKA